MATKKKTTKKAAAKPQKPLDERAVERLEITIRGTAERTRAAVVERVQAMVSSGMDEEVIRERLNTELASGTGQLFAELRQFATAKVPGWTHELTTRFANDTLVDFRKRQAERERIAEAKLTDAGRESRAKASAAQAEILRAAGIDQIEGDFFEPPGDAPLDSTWRWVAVLDTNTCSVCEGNHGHVETLLRWSEIGEPRAGTCAGVERCRCVLVPEEALREEKIPPLLRPRK